MATTSLPLPPPTAAAARPWLGQAVLLAATFVVTLDFFIVNVALPSMRAQLGAGSGAVTVWIAGFAVAFGAFLVLGARLGDRLGRRRTFAAGLGTFTLASAVCGLAPDPTTLAAGRILQGLGAALVSPQVLATLMATTTGHARTRALTAYGLTAGLAAILGQLAGGALIEVVPSDSGWRWCFLVNVPVGIAGVVLAARWVPETRAARTLRTDPASVALLALGLAGLVLGLAEGPGRGWPLWCEVLLAGAVVLLGVFARRQRALARSGRDPLVDLRLLARRGYGVGTVIVFTVQVGTASSFFVLALALQDGLGLGPLASGGVFTTLALGYVASSMVAPGLVAAHGRRVLVAGGLVSAAGQALLALAAGEIHPDGSVLALVPGLVLAGVGLGLLFAPSVSAAVAEVEPERSGEASGVVVTVQQVGNGLGVALLGWVFLAVLQDGGSTADAFRTAQWCLAGQASVVALLALGLARRR